MPTGKKPEDETAPEQSAPKPDTTEVPPEPPVEEPAPEPPVEEPPATSEEDTPPVPPKKKRAPRRKKPKPPKHPTEGTAGQVRHYLDSTAWHELTPEVRIKRAWAVAGLTLKGDDDLVNLEEQAVDPKEFADFLKFKGK